MKILAVWIAANAVGIAVAALVRIEAVDLINLLELLLHAATMPPFIYRNLCAT